MNKDCKDKKILIQRTKKERKEISTNLSLIIIISYLGYLSFLRTDEQILNYLVQNSTINFNLLNCFAAMINLSIYFIYYWILYLIIYSLTKYKRMKGGKNDRRRNS